MPDSYSGRVGLQQRILPAYRAEFFNLLAQACEGGLSIFAGSAASDEGIHPADNLEFAQVSPANNLHFQSPGERFYFLWQRGLQDWLYAWEPDVLIVEANPRYLSTPRAVQWMRQRQRPVIGWGLGAPRGSGALEGLRQRRQSTFINSLDALITYSGRGKDEFSHLGFPKEKIFIANNSVAPPPSGEPNFEYDANRPATVLFVGRLVARKRVDRLIEACSALPEALQPNLVIVGDGPVRGSLEELGRQVYPQATFPRGVHGADLDPYFDQADLFVLPGTGGLAVQEAMAHGLPVLVGKGDGTQDDLVRPENGWTLMGDDPAELTAALSEAVQDRERLVTMGRASYRIVRDEINIEKMVEVFVRALASVTRP